jgi:hypothetical protein
VGHQRKPVRSIRGLPRHRHDWYVLLSLIWVAAPRELVGNTVLKASSHGMPLVHMRECAKDNTRRLQQQETIGAQ